MTKTKIRINPAFFPYLHNHDRFFCCYGGAGSGKSHFIVQKIITRIVKDYGGSKQIGLLLRKTQPSVRTSVFSLMKHYLNLYNLDSFYKINKSELTFNFSNGSQFICRGLDDNEKIKSIAQVNFIWLEEATEFKEDDFDQLNLRLRGTQDSYPKQIFMSFNPISKNNWLYKRFFQKETDNTTILKTTYKDNYFIDDEYRKQLEELAEHNQNYSKIYRLGEWGVLEGVIFQNYKIISEIPKEARKEDDVSFGLDIGFNSPSCLIKCYLYDGLYYFEEVFYQKKMRIEDYVDAFEKDVVKGRDSIGKIYYPCYADTNNPQLIDQLLHDHGIALQPTKKHPNSVIEGIKALQNKPFFVTMQSKNLIAELGSYKWREAKDEPEKANDHSIDAMRYSTKNGEFGKDRSSFHFACAS